MSVTRWVNRVDFGDQVRGRDLRFEQDALASRIGQGLISHRIRPERKDEFETLQVASRFDFNILFSSLYGHLACYLDRRRLQVGKGVAAARLPNKHVPAGTTGQRQRRLN